jgi:hypothetical protein
MGRKRPLTGSTLLGGSLAGKRIDGELQRLLA